MSSELQRMSNEVFLGIKSAHDSMLRALGAPLKPTRGPQSGGMPAIQAEGSSRMAQVRPTPVPAMRAAGTPGPPNRPPTPVPGATASHRPPTPVPGAAPSHRPPTPVPTASPVKLAPHEQTQRGFGEPVARRLTPPMGMPAPAAPQRPTPRPGLPPKPTDALTPDTIRHAGVQPTPPAFDEQRALAEVQTMMQARQWGAARQAMHSLAARVPQSRSYRALLCYARGREAQQAGRSDDAALEFQRALQLDPDLAVAKQALAEAQRRR
jgi:hypothetical protein